ncbi:helix-turn-helix domain-containing protein [Bacillus safensis]|nr:helix-turn-helix domain-containing protein [Bacillus safensis]KAB3544081.1 helix-turn-helix domain-containing protein [Bacillus safensis]
MFVRLNKRKLNLGDKMTNHEAWIDQLIKQLRTRPARNASTKMRQIDLARLIGVDTRTVQLWENGDRMPSVTNLKKLIYTFLIEEKFIEGQEKQEAQHLWGAAKRAFEANSLSNRSFPSFDDVWFDHLLTQPEISDLNLIDTPTETLHTASLQTVMGKRMDHFIGRNKEIEDLHRFLATPQCVTIVGPGGIGKTSLAMKTAQTLSNLYEDGMYVLELSSLQDAALFTHFLYSQLEIKERSNQPELQSILEFIGHKKLLFIFDNCEHLIQKCAELIDQLLSAAPNISIIATSQEPLNIQGERVYRLSPLTKPKKDESYQMEHLLEFEAVRLFIERAKSIVPDLVISQHNIQLIADICTRLDGIPLAIELAASRLNILTLEQILERLDQLLSFLTQGKRTAAPRQQTLKAAIEWSYQLLTQEEQKLLRKISVFVGSFTLEAVEEVCGSSSLIEGKSDEVLHLVSSLVNKSLLSIEQSIDGRRVRYFLLEGIKQYAQEQFNALESEECRKVIRFQYVTYYQQFVLEMDKKFRTSSRDIILASIRDEYAHVLHILTSCYAQTNEQEKRIGLSIIGAMYWFWVHEGSTDEGALWFERFLSVLPAGDGHDSLLAKVYHGQGVLLFILGQDHQSLISASKSLKIARKYKMSSYISSSLRLMTYISLKTHSLETAERYIKESIEVATRAKDVWNIASSYNAYGLIQMKQGNDEQAAKLFKSSIEYFEEVNDKWELSAPYENLGYLALKQGHTKQSLLYFKKVLMLGLMYQGAWIFTRGLIGIILSLVARQCYHEASIMIGVFQKINRASFQQPVTEDYQQALILIRQNHDHHLIEEAVRYGEQLHKEELITWLVEYENKTKG